MGHILKTYKDYILEVGAVIEYQILACKSNNSPIKNPSASHISRIVNIGIDNELKKIIKKYNYSLDSLTSFKDLLLTDFSIPQLYFEDKAIGDFREKFIEKSEEFAINSLNEFLNKFKRKKIMKQEFYKKYDSFFSNIKMKDYEDKRICAELFCYANEFEPISFLTYDKDFLKFLKKNGSKHNVKII